MPLYFSEKLNVWQNGITQATANISINHDPANAQGIKNGDFVFVRVLGHNRAGATIVSFAGQRFEVKTQNPVQTGQSFKARVQIENNSIKLVPQETAAVRLGSRNQILSETPGSADVWRMIAESGLAETDANVKIFQFAKENKTAFSKETLLKLQKKLARYGKNAKTAAEIEAFLADKGINATEEQIEELLLMLDLQNNGENRNGAYQDEEPLERTNAGEDRNIFSRLFTNFSTALAQKPGLLTLANHVSGQNTHWVVLPFATEINEKTWSGSLRFLCDPKQKHTEKFYLSAKNEEKGLIFEFFLPKNMYTDNKKLRVFFAQTPAASFSRQQQLCLLLSDCLNRRFSGIPGFSARIAYRQQVAEEVFTDTSVCVNGVDQVV